MRHWRRTGGITRPTQVANLDVIITERKIRLQTHITSLRREKLQAVEEALHFALGLENRAGPRVYVDKDQGVT